MTLLFSVLLMLCSLCSPVQARLFENASSIGTLDFELDGYGSELGTLTSSGCTEGQGYRWREYYLYDGSPSNQVMSYRVTETPAQSETPNTWVVFNSLEQQSNHIYEFVLNGQFYFYFHYPNPGDVSLTINYWGSSGENIQILIHFVYDADYFNSIFPHSHLLGGQRHNINTMFLHNTAQPGQPRLTYRQTSGSGPGAMSKFGTPRYWVNSAALNLVVEDSDFSYRGLGPDVVMTRTYNADPSDVGMFGNGWHFHVASAFLSPVTIASFLPDPQYRVRRQNESTIPGKEVCPEIPKTSFIDLSLASSIAKLYGFGGFRVVPEIFRAESDPKVRLRCIAQKLMHYSGKNYSVL